MREALVFNASNSLDFQEIRGNVVRIPEVSQAIREAQEIWDALLKTPLDIGNFLCSDDNVFLSQLRLKQFARSVVQVGLYRRFLRYNQAPDFLIGAVNGDSPLRVAIEHVGFVEMVAESEALPRGPSASAAPTAALAADTLLAGVRLDEQAVYQRMLDGGFNRLHFETCDVRKMAESLVANHGVQRFVFVGPGAWKGQHLSGTRMADSLELDPHLGWFWKTASGALAAGRHLAVAN